VPETPAPRAAGITARQLFERNKRPHSALTARGLEKWLLSRGLATNGDGKLHPTPLAFETGAGLT
jgi:hypothetical protein